VRTFFANLPLVTSYLLKIAFGHIA
jgi:hypothetical protein